MMFDIMGTGACVLGVLLAACKTQDLSEHPQKQFHVKVP